MENVYSNELAFVARLADGTIDAWGYGSHGGTIPTAAQAAVDGYKVCCVFSTRSAFAARTVGGALTAWGEPGAASQLQLRRHQRMTPSRLHNRAHTAICEAGARDRDTCSYLRRASSLPPPPLRASAASLE